MPKIFLSYRRRDSAAMAGRIYDRLCDYFGLEAVFIDLTSIPIGVDFREHVALAMDECGVLLAVIGRNWAGNSGAARRLDDPRDPVRMEIEAALERDLPVIPIWIEHAAMPGEADLPASLSRLAYRNAIDVDLGLDFRHHVNRLIKAIEQFLSPPVPGAPVPASQPRKPVTPIEAGSPGPVRLSPGTEPRSTQPSRESTNSIGMKFVRIEPGEFLMGSTKDQVDQLMRLLYYTNRECWDVEQPAHRVKITRAFYLGTCEVTQGQYLAVMGKNPSHFKGSNDLPVECVSWTNAIQFCNKLSALDGRKPFYRIDREVVTTIGGNGYRLPTEAEWEYACRAGSSTLYPFGDDPGALGAYAWNFSNSEGKPHAVGQKRANAWGLYDMLGTVWEWCNDGFDEKYYASSPASDPTGPSGSSRRVFRGGSWGGLARRARPALRFGLVPWYTLDGLGFRVAA